MKFALVHFRAGETDGVSLEMEKWQKALENLGHESFTLAGAGADFSAVLDFRHPRIRKFFLNCFSELIVPEKNLENEFLKLRAICARAIENILQKEKPDFLIVNNVFSLPLNIPFAAALSDIEKRRSGIKITGFHHDFHWERTIYNPTCAAAEKWLSEYFPPKHIKKHIVINSIARSDLLERKKIKAAVFENYFDFSKTFPKKPGKLKRDLKTSENSLLFLHATRIVERKAIEFAIDFLENFLPLMRKNAGKRLYNGKTLRPDTEIHLLFPGLIEEKDYYLKIKKRLEKSPVKAVFCEKICRRHSFWDFYHIADAVTYTSVKEGWGNQFLEAMALRKPAAVFEYPVFKSDIKKFGFKIVSLGNKFGIENGIRRLPAERLQRAAAEMTEILTNRKTYRQITDFNHKLAKKHLSITALQKDIGRFFGI